MLIIDTIFKTGGVVENQRGQEKWRTNNKEDGACHIKPLRCLCTAHIRPPELTLWLGGDEKKPKIKYWELRRSK